jgi:soluble epoxide hydrolase / lipid-phosphate phosphatase
LESFFTVLFPRDESQFKALFTTRGAIQDFIEADKLQPTADFATEEMKSDFVSRFKKDGYTGPFNWYKSFVFNHHWPDEKGIFIEQFFE